MRDLSEGGQEGLTSQEFEKKIVPMLDDMDAPVLVFSSDKLIYLNDSFKKNYGYGAEPPSSIDIRLWPARVDRERLLAYLFDKSGKETGRGIRCAIVKSDGEIARLPVFRLQVPDVDGGPTMACIIAEGSAGPEILDDKREDLFRRMADNALGGISVVDESLDTIYANRAMLEMFGFETLEELNKTHILNLIAPESLDYVYEQTRKWVLGEGGDTRLSFRIIRADGEPRDINLLVSEIWNEGRRYFLSSVLDVTERSGFEKKLRESEERYRLHFDHVQEIFFSVDQDLRITSMSPSIEQTLGYRPEEMVGTTFSRQRIFSPDSVERAYFDIRNALSGSTLTEVEYEFIARDGSRKAMAMSMKPFFEGKKVTQIFCVARDITERKKAQDAVRESEEKYRLLFHSSPESITLIGLDGTILETNRANEVISGLAREEMVGKPYTEVNTILEEDIPGYAEVLKKLLTGDGIEPFEIRIIRTDGEPRWLEVYPSLLRKEGGPYAIQAITRDITERRKAEEELRKLGAAVDQTREGVAMADLDGYIVFANPAWASMHGYDGPDGLVGRHLSIFHTEEQMKEDVVPFNRKVIEKGSHEDEVGHVKKDGEEFPSHMSTTLFRDREGSPIGFIGMARDITERKKAEEEIRYRLEFEKVVTGISNRFINLGPEKVDNEIEEVLRVLGEFVGVDRSYVFLFEDDLEKAWMEYEWHKPEHGPQKENFLEIWSRDFPWWLDVLKQGKAINLTSLDKIPENETGIRKTLEKNGVKSLIVVPMFLRERLIGFLGFNSRTEKSWSDNESALVKVIGEMLVNALDRKRAEEALLESEAKYRLLAEGTNDVIWTIDMEMNNTYVSPAIEGFRGYTPEDHLNQPIDKILTEDSYNRVMAGLMDELKLEEGGDADPGRSRTLELEYIHKHGHTVWGELTATFMRDGSGNIIGVHGVTRDITERRKHQEELKESEAKYRMLAENTSDIIWMMDMDLNMIYTSPSIERMTGYTPEENENLPIIDKLAPDSLKLAFDALKEEFEKEKDPAQAIRRSRTLELKYFRKDGKQIWVEETMTFMRDGEGKPIGIHGVSREISKRKQAEDMLKESNDKFISFVNDSFYGYFEMDLNGRILFANKNAEKITGYSLEDDREMDFRRIIHEEDLKMAEEDLAEALTGPNEGPGEYRIVTRDGRVLHTEINTLPLKKDGQLVGCLGTIMDITERKKAEEVVKRSEEHFKSLVENVSDLVSIVDQNGIIKYSNPATEEILGYDPLEIIGKNMMEFIHPEDLLELAGNMEAQMKAHGSVNHMEARFRHKDGSYRILDGKSTNMYHDPIVNGLITYSRDITERRMSRVESEEKTRMLEALVDTMTNGVFVLDEEGKYLMIRPPSNMADYDTTDWIGRRPGKLVHPDDREKFERELGRAIQGESVSVVSRFLLNGNDSYVPYRVIMRPMQGSGKARVFGVGQLVNADSGN